MTIEVIQAGLGVDTRGAKGGGQRTAAAAATGVCCAPCSREQADAGAQLRQSTLTTTTNLDLSYSSTNSHPTSTPAQRLTKALVSLARSGAAPCWSAFTVAVWEAASAPQQPLPAGLVVRLATFAAEGGVARVPGKVGPAWR